MVLRGAKYGDGWKAKHLVSGAQLTENNGNLVEIRDTYETRMLTRDGQRTPASALYGLPPGQVESFFLFPCFTCRDYIEFQWNVVVAGSKLGDGIGDCDVTLSLAATTTIAGGIRIGSSWSSPSRLVLL